MPNIGSAPVSLNHQPGLIVQSSSAVRSDPMVELYADPTTHRLLVDAAITIDNLTVSENIAQIGGATITLGQKTMVNSLPVTLASDQLPAGAALTDSLANPTTTVIGSMLMGYNSSSWERLRTDLGDGSVSTGLQNIVPMLYNGTTYDRLPGSTIGLQVKGGYTEVSFTTTTVQAVATTEVSNYKWVSVHITSQGTSSTVTFQGSNDNTNWVNVALIATLSVSGNSSVTSATAAGMWHGAVGFRYFRLNVTGISAGTTAGVIEFYTTPTNITGPAVGAVQTGTWNVGSNSATGSAVPANAFYIGGLGSSGNLAGFGLAGAIGDASGNNTATAAAYVYNGTNWDRLRGNEDVTLLASSARTTTQTSADLVNYNGRSALIVVLDMTVVGTGSVTISINRKDTASGKYITILTGAAVTTNSTNVYKVGPNIAAAANSIAQDYLGRTFQIVVTANNANSCTYSVGYSLVRG